MAEMLIDEDTIEIIDTTGNFERAVKGYEKKGWKIMFFSSDRLNPSNYCQAIMCMNEDVFFNTMFNRGELFNATDKY